MVIKIRLKCGSSVSILFDTLLVVRSSNKNFPVGTQTEKDEEPLLLSMYDRGRQACFDLKDRFRSSTQREADTLQ